MLNKKQTPDGRPTISEWPVRIWNENELPPQYAAPINKWIQGNFADYDFVYAPKRKTNESSFDYIFGYGKDKIIYMTINNENASRTIEIQRQQVTEILTERELLNAKIILHYQTKTNQNELQFPYVPSVYYLYDPFLNWLLGLEKEFMPAAAEAEHPRPQELFYESLTMFNYSLGAYRLGSGFTEYQYQAKQHRSKWMPWKKTIEEWLKIQMERGLFELHSFGYLTECVYHIC